MQKPAVILQACEELTATCMQQSLHAPRNTFLKENIDYFYWTLGLCFISYAGTEAVPPASVSVCSSYICH